jgi:hypothetical protein
MKERFKQKQIAKAEGIPQGLGAITILNQSNINQNYISPVKNEEANQNIKAPSKIDLIQMYSSPYIR